MQFRYDLRDTERNVFGVVKDLQGFGQFSEWHTTFSKVGLRTRQISGRRIDAGRGITSFGNGPY
jgi:hypothetical protein